MVVLLAQASVRAQAGGLIGDKPEAAIAATGLDNRPSARSFFKRARGKLSALSRVKLTLTCDSRSPFFTSATVPLGPRKDWPQFQPALDQACLIVSWDRLLGDAAFASEDNHRLAREEGGVRSTVIPSKRRNPGRQWPKTKYRRQMHKRFPNRKYGQRWQADSAVARHKRRLGSALTCRSQPTRERECRLRVLTHNLMLLADTDTSEGFNRARRD